MENARASFEKEVEIMKMIRSKRFVHLALKHLLDPVLHKQLKTLSKFQEINSEQKVSTLLIAPVKNFNQGNMDL